MKAKGAICLTLAAVLIVLFVGGWIAYVLKDWEMNRNVMGWKNRAQVAANAEDMHLYLDNMVEGMESYGMTKGHYALIFKEPWNDIELDYKTVNKVIERIENIENMDRGSTAYGVAMDDVRGIIRELELDPLSWWYINKALFTLMWLWLGWIPIAILILFGLALS